MIKIFIGNVGSGKSLSTVRGLIANPPNHKVYSNIIPKSKRLKNIITPINNQMIVKKEFVKDVKKRDGSIEPVYKLSLNVDFWKSIPKPCTIILDEIHQVLNPRKSMSKVNIIMLDWLSLLRRAIGSTSGEYGELIMITQLPRRVDVVAKEMATQVRYHRMSYVKECKRCHYKVHETNDHPEPIMRCINCNHPYLLKYGHSIEVWHFSDFERYEAWKYSGAQTYHMNYHVKNVENYFKDYDSFQWDNMMSDLYE